MKTSPPEASIVTVTRKPVDMFADAVTAEAGTGGSRDVINASNVDVVTTGLADTDYT